MSLTRNGLPKRRVGATDLSPQGDIIPTLAADRAARLLAIAQEYLGDRCVRLSITPREDHPVVYIGSVAAGFEGGTMTDQLFPTDDGFTSVQRDTIFSSKATASPFLQPQHVDRLRAATNQLAVPLLHISAVAGHVNPTLQIDALDTPHNDPVAFEPLPETGAFVRLNLISPEEALDRLAKDHINNAIVSNY